MNWCDYRLWDSISLAIPIAMSPRRTTGIWFKHIISDRTRLKICNVFSVDSLNSLLFFVIMFCDLCAS